MNQKGSMESMISAIIGLFVAIVVLYTVLVVWDPITNLLLFPLLNNAEAFPYGGAAVTLLQVIILVIVAVLFLAFFNEARGGGRPPQYYG